MSGAIYHRADLRIKDAKGYTPLALLTQKKGKFHKISCQQVIFLGDSQLLKENMQTLLKTKEEIV